MEAVRKIVEVKNNAITVKGLDCFNNKRVEVIVLPLPEEESAPEGTGNLHQFAGTVKKFGDGMKYQKKIRSEG